jgi:glucose-6-phosphate isomerase
MEFVFGKKVFQSEVRKASDLKPVLAFPEALKEDFDAYYMFRDSFKTDEEAEIIRNAGLRYDYTVIPPNNIGGESIKTYGHYHPEVVRGFTYPEVYQVLEGEALFILQKPSNGKIEDVIVVEGKKWDTVIIPPNYGHVTINPTESDLITANWVYRNFSSIYEPYTKRRGACYYYINGEWVRNRNYDDAPEIRFAKPKNVLDVKGDMYDLVYTIEKLEFLVKPHEHQEIFENAFEVV